MPIRPRTATSPPVSARRAEPLTRERIVGAALDLVDRAGLKALSMRRLGAALGVDPMAVYYHLPNKEALLDAIVEAVMAEIDLGRDHPDDPPEERILCAARAYRDAMLAHRNALPIVLARGPATLAALRPVELLLGVLRGCGLAPEQALAGMNAIAAAVRGAAGMAGAPDAKPRARELAATLAGLPGNPFPHLGEALRCAGDAFEPGFEFGIRALARGLMAAAPGNGDNLKSM